MRIRPEFALRRPSAVERFDETDDESAGGRPDVAAEVPCEMRLVVEPDRDGDVGDGLALEEQRSSRVDPPADHVPVRGDAERARERTHEVSGRGVQRPTCVGEHDPVEPVLVEEFAELTCDLVRGTNRVVRSARSEVVEEPLRGDRQRALDLERVRTLLHGAVNARHRVNDRPVLGVGAIDGGAGGVRRPALGMRPQAMDVTEGSMLR